MTTDPSSGQPGENRPADPAASTPPPPPPPQSGPAYPQYPSGQQPSGYPQYPAGQQPPPGYGPQPGWGGPPPPQTDSNTRSIAAIVLGLVAVIIFPIICGPIAIVLAVMAKRKGERLATTALWVAIGGMVAGFIIGAIVYSNMVA